MGRPCKEEKHPASFRGRQKRGGRRGGEDKYSKARCWKGKKRKGTLNCFHKAQKKQRAMQRGKKLRLALWGLKPPRGEGRRMEVVPIQNITGAVWRKGIQRKKGG